MLDYILDKIRTTETFKDPYEHLIIDNFIPEDDYKILAEEINSINLLEAPDNRENVEVYRERGGLVGEAQAVGDRVISFVKDQNKFPNYKKIDEFTSLWLDKQKEIFTALSETFSIKRESYEFLDFCLIKDETDYQILPHTDQPGNVFTLLFYCPVDTINRELGLSIYEEGTGSYINTRDAGPKLLREYKKAEFLPNRLVCFTRTDSTWHGVGSDNVRLEGSRNSCQIFFMNPNS